MKVSIVLTVISDDRPGVVEQLSKILTAHSGSWVESSMLSLAGKFSGILYAAVADQYIDHALAAFEALNANGMQVQAATHRRRGGPQR